MYNKGNVIKFKISYFICYSVYRFVISFKKRKRHKCNFLCLIYSFSPFLSFSRYIHLCVSFVWLFFSFFLYILFLSISPHLYLFCLSVVSQCLYVTLRNLHRIFFLAKGLLRYSYSNLKLSNFQGTGPDIDISLFD